MSKLPAIGDVPKSITNFIEKKFFQAVKSAIETLTSNVSQIVIPDTSVEAWHELGAPGEPSYQNGWTTTTNRHFGFRKLTAINCVHLHGRITPGTETDSTIIFTLSMGYVPTTNYRYNIHSDIVGSAGGALIIASDGNVMIVNAVTTGTFYDVNIIFPLDV